MPNPRPQGRMAKPEASSRKGQRWDGLIEPIFSTSAGKLTAREFMAKRQRAEASERFSMVKIRLEESVFSRRSCICGGEIEVHSDGRAVCKGCNVVFNDGGNTEGMLKITNYYSDGSKEEVLQRPHEREPLSKDHRWLTNHFIKRVAHS